MPDDEKSKSVPMFFLMAAVTRVADDAADYANASCFADIWVKAQGKEIARKIAKKLLADEGWQMKTVKLAIEVTAGYARLGAMVDPPVFSEQEADDWTEHFYSAEKEGIQYAIDVYTKGT